MKNTVIILMLFSTMYGHGVVSQEWAPIGAEWYYNLTQNTFPALSGYVKIVCMGDTLIEGKNCRVLETTRIVKNPPPYVDDTLIMANEYLWIDSGNVYNYRHGQFHTLYDFNAQPGDKWIVHGDEFNVYHDTIGTVVVDSIGETIVNNVTLKVIYTSAGDGSDWWLGDMIIEKIGPVHGFMFPLGTGIVYFQKLTGDSLRCYHDNSFGGYATGIAPECDYISKVDNHKAAARMFKVFPNPAKNRISIVSGSAFPGHIKLLDIYGQVLGEMRPNGKKASFDVSAFPKGVYLIEVKQNNKKMIYKFIKN